jgi:hypothetical protein
MLMPARGCFAAPEIVVANRIHTLSLAGALSLLADAAVDQENPAQRD